MGYVTVNQVAYSTYFDNETNGFIADNVQDAIEEVKDTIEGKIVYVVTILHNGTVSNGTWLGKGDTMPNATSYIAPRAVEFLGLSWSNKNSDVDFDLEFYKNGRDTTKFRTYEVRNLDYGYIQTWDDLLVAGDRIDIKYIDQGDNAADLAVDLVFKAV